MALTPSKEQPEPMRWGGITLSAEVAGFKRFEVRGIRLQVKKWLTSIWLPP
jgi:hypothetical protein